MILFLLLYVSPRYSYNLAMDNAKRSKKRKGEQGQQRLRKHASISVGALRHTTHVVNVFTFKHTISTKKLVSGSKSIGAKVLKITSINVSN